MAGSGSIQSYQLSAQLILDARERAEARFNALSMTLFLRAFSLIWVSTKSGEVHVLDKNEQAQGANARVVSVIRLCELPRSLNSFIPVLAACACCNRP